MLNIHFCVIEVDVGYVQQFISTYLVQRAEADSLLSTFCTVKREMKNRRKGPRVYISANATSGEGVLIRWCENNKVQ